MIPHSEWVWYGYAGHLIVGSRCAYHLTTRVGKFLISTVGHYMPNGRDKETIGAGEADFFETMVFPCEGETASGDPNISSWESAECARYATSIDAERCHRLLCLKYAEMPLTREGNGNG